MHRVIRDHLEEVLAEAFADRVVGTRSNRNQDFDEHLRQCEECRLEIEQMREHAALLRELRAEPASEPQWEPKAGFYARVLDRIEAQRPSSFWTVFSESPFGKRVAIASMTLALVFGIYMFASETYLDQQQAAVPVEMSNPPDAPGPLPGEDQPGLVLGRSGAPDRDAVLVNLVTYREQ